MKTHTPFLSRCLLPTCITILFLVAMAFPAAASTAMLPEAGRLHAAHDLTAVFTIGGFFLALAGLGGMELARRKKRSADQLPVGTGRPWWIREPWTPLQFFPSIPYVF